MRDVAVTVLLFAGVALEVFAVIGVLLMRGALDRLHYTSVSALAGMCLGASVVVESSFSLIGNKAVLLAVFLAVTSPVLAHVLARALHRQEQERRG
jgi:monovalent cation/proton antiporter MnhG/PhaG subunit